jgi:hypothetical protein
MKNPRKNQRIRVIRETRGYERDRVYTIDRVDTSDNTLTAADASGKVGPWVQWINCAPAGPDVGWDWLKAQLPGEVLELLTAFQGLEKLRLKNEVRDHILLQIPNLKERILQAQVALDEEFGGEAFPEPEDAAGQNQQEEPELP